MKFFGTTGRIHWAIPEEKIEEALNSSLRLKSRDEALDYLKNTLRLPKSVKDYPFRSDSDNYDDRNADFVTALEKDYGCDILYADFYKVH